MSKSSPKHPGYKKMKDTAWIKQGRQIADAGGKGILGNYGSVNVFDDDTRRSLEDYNNSIYQRAFNDMNRSYNDIMNSYAARNYNRFGSLNNTPSARAIDDYQRQFQRQMDDASYSKAMNYENLINNELNRRYKTLGMFEDLYGYGQTPYQQDVNNWNIENTNRDIRYKNQAMGSSGGFSLGNMARGAMQGATVGAQTGNPYGALIGGVAGGALGAMGGRM